MRRIKIIALLLFSITLLGSEKPIIVLTAEPGHFDFHEIGDATTKAKVEVELKIIEFNPSNEWPTAAYFGFYDSIDRNNSVHFLLLRNKIVDKYSVAGYRVIKNGEEVIKKRITQIEVDNSVSVTMEFDNGEVSLKINCEEPVYISTDLKSVVPSVSVSSGRAYFDISI